MGDDVTDNSTGNSLSFPENYYLGGDDAVYEFVGSGSPVEMTQQLHHLTLVSLFEGNPNEGDCFSSFSSNVFSWWICYCSNNSHTNYFVVVDSCMYGVMTL